MQYLKIFTNFLDVTAALSNGAMGRLSRAMLLYAEDGTEPVFQGKEAVAWAVAKQQIDREAQVYAARVEASRENGRKGACARWHKSEQTYGDGQETYGEDDQEKDKEKEKSKEKVKGKERERTGAAPLVSAAASRALSVPTLEEVEAYCRERGNRVNARRFMDFYSANGWRVGKNPMRDWKATVRSWETNGVDDARPASRPTSYLDEYKAVMEMARMEEAKEL